MLSELLRCAPVTRSLDEVRQLLAKAKNPPVSIALNQEEILVLNAKRDAYYTVTPRGCSCPASVYFQGPCKHRRKYFPGQKKTREELDAEGEAILDAHHKTPKWLARPPEDGYSLRPTGKWPGGYNGPWVE